MRSLRVLAALAVTATSAQAQSADTTARTDSTRVTQLETINVTAERPRAVGAAGHHDRGVAGGAAPDLRGRRLRSAAPDQRHRGPRAGPGPRLRLGRRDPRLLVGPFLGRAPDPRRRADQPPGARPRRGLLRLEHPLARGGELAPGHHRPRQPALRRLLARRRGRGVHRRRRGRHERAACRARATATPAAGCGAAGEARRRLPAGGRGPASAGLARQLDATGWATARVRGWRRAGTGRLEGGVSLYGSSWDSPGFVSASPTTTPTV